MRPQHQGGLGARFEDLKATRETGTLSHGSEEPREVFRLDSDTLGLVFWKKLSG